ncbi:MAG: hypothetical protein ACT4P2_07910 [Pseudomonadota bacterium]
MNFLYVCTLTHPLGTIAAAAEMLPLEKLDSYLGQPVTGAWLETADGRIAMTWGEVPARIKAAPSMFETYAKSLGPPM